MYNTNSLLVSHILSLDKVQQLYSDAKKDIENLHQQWIVNDNCIATLQRHVDGKTIPNAFKIKNNITFPDNTEFVSDTQKIQQILKQTEEQILDTVMQARKGFETTLKTKMDTWLQNHVTLFRVWLQQHISELEKSKLFALTFNTHCIDGNINNAQSTSTSAMQLTTSTSSSSSSSFSSSAAAAKMCMYPLEETIKTYSNNLHNIQRTALISAIAAENRMKQDKERKQQKYLEMKQSIIDNPEKAIENIIEEKVHNKIKESMQLPKNKRKAHSTNKHTQDTKRLKISLSNDNKQNKKDREQQKRKITMMNNKR
ncbi:MAG: hypothetical protein Q7V20_21875 [Aquabacterium sp.]|uniref:hypothetical protein n=1 Tax=Aquabacterium sp. TaxID=1872578 RepID=UPI0027185E02|nr:hypothetical protein [Aquabacterium sp.]MDO9006101.1 hypothetical protein [Aquabacterium sp.]